MGSVFDGASMRSYRDDLSGCSPLDRETERDLARRWIDGDEDAGERIVRACLPFVVSIALEYRRWGIPLEDIVQQGNLGLLRAARKFDPAKECRLATYAAYWIRAEIREYVVRAYRVVRLGTTKGERKALRAYRTLHERDPDVLAQISGLSRERIDQLMPLLASREASLDATTGDMGPAIERLASRDPSPEDEAGSSELRDRAREAVATALRDLTERELLIVRGRMMNDEPITLQRLGEMLGVSKERVRQLEERAKDKLKGRLGGFREHAHAL